MFSVRTERFVLSKLALLVLKKSLRDVAAVTIEMPAIH